MIFKDCEFYDTYLIQKISLVCNEGLLREVMLEIYNEKTFRNSNVIFPKFTQKKKDLTMY